MSNSKAIPVQEFTITSVACEIFRCSRLPSQRRLREVLREAEERLEKRYGKTDFYR